MSAASVTLALTALGAILAAMLSEEAILIWVFEKAMEPLSALLDHRRRSRRPYRQASDPARYARLGWRRFRDVDRLPLMQVEQVLFYKRDLSTVDLVCCDVAIGGRVLTFHENAPNWNRLLRHVAALPGFRADWREHVLIPAFASPFTAFRRR